MAELDTLIDALKASKDHQPPDTKVIPSAFRSYQNRSVTGFSSCTMQGLITAPSYSEFSLSYCESQLYTFSKEVKLLQSRLQFLSTEEERGRITKLRANSRLRSIGRLPNEILSRILLLAMASCGANIWRAPALAVSHRWRDCALAEPRIWQTICVTDNSRAEEVVTWLARAHRTQLNIHYILPLVWMNSLPMEVHFPILQSLISPHSQHTRSMLYDVGLKTEHLFPLHIPSSSLKTLSIVWQHSPSLLSPLGVFQQDAPSGLCDLSLDTHDIPDHHQVILNDFDVSSLIRLKVGQAVTISSIWLTLSRSKMLRDLTWYIDGDRQTAKALDDQNLVAMTIPALQSVYLGDNDATLSFLKKLETPLLERLRIGGEGTLFRDILPQILRRDQLRRLALGYIPGITEVLLRELFQKLPMLEVFLCDAWTPGMIAALKELCVPATTPIHGNSRSWSAPNLRTIYIHDSLLDSPYHDVETGDQEHTELVRAMKKHIPLLLVHRRLLMLQPLSIVLKSCKALKEFEGMEGIEWDDECSSYAEWIWEGRLGHTI